ncbi:MAG: hypothetical protein LBH04_06005 [Tannerellaceae bacterium]|jgi:hypothetical protein|nr:hypothetical protein [Tannerellaceae bacterium]
MNKNILFHNSHPPLNHASKYSRLSTIGTSNGDGKSYRLAGTAPLLNTHGTVTDMTIFK